jgi:HD-like signal output (HDOD) protein
MPDRHPQTRSPTPIELRSLVPLRELSDDYLELLGRHTDVVRAPKGARVRQRGRAQTALLFLLQGTIRMEDADGETQEISSGTTRARFPLVPEGRNDSDGLCLRPCELLRLPLKNLGKVRRMARAEAEALAEQPQPEKTPEQLLEERILEDFRAAIDAGRLQLPGMPEVAARISAHIDSLQATSASIARIVQTDPAITARLIQVANSAFYAPRTPVRTCRDAVTRLGRDATRELVTSFVLRGLFRTRSPGIKSRMQALWRHSTQVAALSHVLARRCPGFEPARAMLVGLVHDIGTIPLLTYAHRYEGLVEDPVLLDRVVNDLRGEVGALTLTGWDFAEEFVIAAREAEDWARDPGPEPDYTDLLIVAQLHAYLGTPRMAELPRIDEVPAFRKLALGTLSPRMSLVLLDEAEQEIEEVRLMLG